MYAHVRHPTLKNQDWPRQNCGPRATALPGPVMTRTPLIFVVLLATSCGLASPSAGRVVSPGVGEAFFETRANDTDVLRVRVLFPAQSDGRPRSGPFPSVVFVQGGFVPTQRYAWQGEALAQQGWVVAMPEHPLELAFFSIENGAVARELLAAPPSKSLLEGLVDPKRIAVAGHSLGGVVAIKLALLRQFQALVVQAGFSDTADDTKLPALGLPSLFLTGAKDCQAKLTQVEAGWAKLPSPTALVVLPGMTHYGFTDSDADDAVKCPPEAALERSHTRIISTMTGFLGAALDDGSVGESALRAVDGVEVSVR